MFENLIYREDFVKVLNYMDEHMAELEERIYLNDFLSEEEIDEFHKLLKEGRSAVEKARSDFKKKVPMIYSEVLTPIYNNFKTVDLGDQLAELRVQYEYEEMLAQFKDREYMLDDEYEPMPTEEECHMSYLEELYADEIAEERKLIALEEEENN